MPKPHVAAATACSMRRSAMPPDRAKQTQQQKPDRFLSKQSSFAAIFRP
jgi:hypothetical protein